MKAPRYIAFGSVDPSRLPALLELYHTDVLRLFTKGLSFADNHQCDIVTVQFNTDTAPIRVALQTLKAPPSAIWVMRAQERGQDNVMSGNAVTWSFTNGAVNIVAIDGLTASTFYNVTLLMVGG